MQEQQLKVLLMLIEREGEIVTREEIKKKLWPNDTVVEFDHGINNTIKNLRRLLDDSADDPIHRDDRPARLPADGAGRVGWGGGFFAEESAAESASAVSSRAELSAVEEHSRSCRGDLQIPTLFPKPS